MATPDHLALATQDLAGTVALLADLLGVAPSPGGRHPALGTRNHLLRLGPATYLEVIGPDPDLPDPDGPRPFGVDEAVTPRLGGWAVAVDDIGAAVAGARALGYDPGEPMHGERHNPDGSTVAWWLTTFLTPHRRIVPFLMQWESVPHPAETAAPGCRLVSLHAEHPEPPAVTAWPALALDVPLRRGDEPRLVAEVEGPAGRVLLTSDAIHPA
jgi:hypothetical protein